MFSYKNVGSVKIKNDFCVTALLLLYVYTDGFIIKFFIFEIELHALIFVGCVKEELFQ